MLHELTVELGRLDAVRSLRLTPMEFSILLTWTPPFSFDITDVDPDITYCVDVQNVVSSTRLHSECKINATNFTFQPASPIWCDKFLFTVTSVNVVGNGTMNKELVFRAENSKLSH